VLIERRKWDADGEGQCVAALRVSDRLVKRLATLLADDRCDADGLMARLRELRDAEGAPACSAALRALAHLEIPETQAEQLLLDLLHHRGEVARALGRDPGLRVAAIDYLSNVKGLLANPTILERSALERTERSAVTDPLTKLFNRRYFARALALEVRRSHRYSLRLAVLMLDLDEFKRLNDRHGHLFGDLVLQRVGEVIRRAVRDADTPCRYGGEEFCVLLPETDRLGAYAVAERVRDRVRGSFEQRVVRGVQVDVRLSGGIAAYPVDGESGASLLARADQALYLAKHQGKDRIRLYHSERREAIRYPARAAARVTLRAGGTPAAARIVNVSRRGALLDLGAEAIGGPAVEVVFAGYDAAGRPCAWSAAGHVVRVERSAAGARRRLAVRFDAPLNEECLLQQAERTSALRAVQGGPA
jgi:diguanylate cyclase (GGDEF)-like protein